MYIKRSPTVSETPSRSWGSWFPWGNNLFENNYCKEAHNSFWNTAGNKTLSQLRFLRVHSFTWWADSLWCLHGALNSPHFSMKHEMIHSYLYYELQWRGNWPNAGKFPESIPYRMWPDCWRTQKISSCSRGREYVDTPHASKSLRTLTWGLDINESWNSRLSIKRQWALRSTSWTRLEWPPRGLWHWCLPGRPHVRGFWTNNWCYGTRKS